MKKLSKIQKVTNKVVLAFYPIKCLPNVNVSALVLQNFIVVVDSGGHMPSGKDFRDELLSKFHLPIKYLILTHDHIDHSGSIVAFKDVIVICNEYTAKKHKARQTRVFENTFTVTDGNLAIEIQNVGGHTRDSTIIFYPDEKVLFAGDLVMTIGYPPYGGDTTCDPEKWSEALGKMLKLEPDYIIPGHGPILTGKGFNQYVRDFNDFKSVIFDAFSNNISFRKVQIPEFEGIPYSDWLAKTTYNGWIKYYRMRNELEEMPEKLLNMSSGEKQTYLSKKTKSELDLIAQKFQIKLEGVKRERIRQLMDHLAVRNRGQTY